MRQAGSCTGEVTTRSTFPVCRKPDKPDKVFAAAVSAEFTVQVLCRNSSTRGAKRTNWQHRNPRCSNQKCRAATNQLGLAPATR